MRDGDYEHRGVVVSGIEWENMPYPALRVCACGRKIARISTADICQRCIDREYEKKFQRGRHGQHAPDRHTGILPRIAHFHRADGASSGGGMMGKASR